MGMLLRRHYAAAELVAEPLDRPAPSATKKDWVAYATQEGHDVEGLKRDEIVALFSESEAEPVTDEAPADVVDTPAEEAPAADAEPDTE